MDHVEPDSARPQLPLFADQLTVWGIPNFWNVVSNLGFVISGLYGLWVSVRTKPTNPIYFTLHLGVLLTGFGSAYYHWNPIHETLVPDRLPMTIVFSSLFCLILADYLDYKKVLRIWMVLLPVSMGSVLYWYVTELNGQGDLRPYLLVQFLPMLLIPYLWLFGNSRKLHPQNTIVLILVFYVLAKLAEAFDPGIYRFTGVIGGHPFKHLLAAVSTWFMVSLRHKP